MIDEYFLLCVSSDASKTLFVILLHVSELYLQKSESLAQRSTVVVTSICPFRYSFDHIPFPHHSVHVPSPCSGRKLQRHAPCLPFTCSYSVFQSLSFSRLFNPFRVRLYYSTAQSMGLSPRTTDFHSAFLAIYGALNSPIFCIQYCRVKVAFLRPSLCKKGILGVYTQLCPDCFM